MKKVPWVAAEVFRQPHPWGRADYGDDYGFFEIPGPCAAVLRVIVSNAHEGNPWEHVSVSLPNRCPNWKEMHFIKEMFWDDTEAVMQLHPPKREYVNCHPFCLHLWRPTDKEIPLPPSILVGPDSFKVTA